MTNSLHNGFKLFAAISMIALLSGLVGCQNTDSKKGDSLSYLEKHEQAFSQEVDLSGIPKVYLTPEAKKGASNWTEYMTVKSELKKLPDFSLQELVNNSKNIAHVTKILQDSISQKFNTKAIQSRINVLVTKAAIFEQYTNRYKIDTATVQNYGRVLYTAFNNLKIQLNEVYLLKTPDFEVSIDKKQDSILRTKQLEQSEKMKEDVDNHVKTPPDSLKN